MTEYPKGHKETCVNCGIMERLHPVHSLMEPKRVLCKKFKAKNLIPKDVQEELNKLKTFKKAQNHSQLKCRGDKKDLTTSSPSTDSKNHSPRGGCLPEKRNRVKFSGEGTQTLSEKIRNTDFLRNILYGKDVKNFIKKLKEAYCEEPEDPNALITIPIHELNKLAGKELI